MNEKIGKYGISAIVLLSMLAMVIPVSAQPTADSFGVNNARGAQGTSVIVPVNITNASNGPILDVVFNIAYDKSVINVTDVLRGELTSDWNDLEFNNDLTWGTRVLVTGPSAYAIPNGSSGSVVLLNFFVTGNPDEISDMNVSGVQLPDISGQNIGTAPPKNGTFYVTGLPPVPVPEYSILGLLALTGLLSFVLAISIRKRS